VATTTQTYATTYRYADRRTKARYIALKYESILSGSVLDVGCDERQLGAELGGGARYVGVDLNASADLVIDLERDDLPFEDRSFDTVVCADVLEHLDRCHAVFDELCRVAESRVVVALPNPLRNLVEAIGSGSGGDLKHYGLPVDPPADRHKWLFGQRDAERFIRERGARAGFEVEQLDLDMCGCCPWRDGEGTNLLDDQNFTGGNTWCVLRRRPA
jgi:hypothetical protein